MDGDSPFHALPSLTAGLTPPRLPLDRLDPRVIRELRASHVGEVVAVRMYDGILAARCSPTSKPTTIANAPTRPSDTSLPNRPS